MSIQIAGGWMHYGTNEFLRFKGVSC
jgi:hypothetical protein